MLKLILDTVDVDEVCLTFLPSPELQFAILNKIFLDLFVILSPDIPGVFVWTNNTAGSE